MWVRSLDWEDPLEEGIATQSSIVRKIPWTEKPGGLQNHGVTKSWTPLTDQGATAAASVQQFSLDGEEEGIQIEGKGYLFETLLCMLSLFASDF